MLAKFTISSEMPRKIKLILQLADFWQPFYQLALSLFSLHDTSVNENAQLF